MKALARLTFEIQDIPAMTDIAKAHGIITLIDNTWGTALHFDAFAKGIDIVIEAGTKYITGHSDTNLGVICGHGAKIAKVRLTARTMGICAGPEDLYLGARGLRTMHLRLKESEKNGLALAQFTETQDVVTSVLHPALPHHLITRSIHVTLRVLAAYLALCLINASRKTPLIRLRQNCK